MYVDFFQEIFMDIFISNVTTTKCNNMHVREMLLDRSIQKKWKIFILSILKPIN